MQVVCVRGGTPQTAREAADRIAAHLDTLGPVGIVEIAAQSEDSISGETMTAIERHELTEDAWRAVGPARPPTAVLETLAPELEYVVIVGEIERQVPIIAVGDVETADQNAIHADSVEEINRTEVVATIEAAEPYETLESLVAQAKRSDGTDRAGAIATFTGRVRRYDGPDDPATERLEFEKYDGVADRRLETIRADLEARDGVETVLLHHRTGAVTAGEDIVFVVVLAAHRGEAFTAVQDGIDRLKAEVPFFKKEITVDGDFWRHEAPDT